MSEKVDKRIYKTLQEANSITLLSTNSNNNYMGYSSPTLDNLYNENGNIYEVYQVNETLRPEKISYQIANYFGKQNYENGFECVRSLNNGKCNSINERRKDHKIYVQSISLKWNNNRNDNERYAVKNNRSVKKNSRFAIISKKIAPNQCIGWQYMDERKARNTVSFCGPKFEIITNKSDHKCVAKLLNRYIESKEPTTYKYYLKDIKEDYLMSVLWSLGDYLNMAKKESLTKRVI
ncbi:hypothetical protein C1645_821353 [Glomus cerebriforme]|uniref:Uncharacterized protein n=1 Tax=Glomus cerebriforme TaxID=658196 RepID=A0A397TA84_9GLOM|nr:hypothetical protein C1645_821353 [Glomus cerebriforme]